MHRRLILMLMVVVIHVLTHGGVIKATEQLSANYICPYFWKAVFLRRKLLCDDFRMCLY